MNLHAVGNTAEEKYPEFPYVHLGALELDSSEADQQVLDNLSIAKYGRTRWESQAQIST